MIVIFNELESVEYLRQTSLSTYLSPVTLDNNRQRLFNYVLIGRQCNTTWTIFKKISLMNSSIEHVDTNTSVCTRITYPISDALISDDSGLYCLERYSIFRFFCYLGWRILKIVLFVLLGIVLALAAALIGFLRHTVCLNNVKIDSTLFFQRTTCSKTNVQRS